MDCRNELGFLELPGVRGAHSQVERIFARLHPIMPVSMISSSAHNSCAY